MCLVLIILIFTTWLQSEEFEQKISIGTQNLVSPLAERARKVNSQLEAISVITDKLIPWSKVFDEINSATPVDINIKNETADGESGLVLISGFASTREGLLDYQKKLQGLPFVKTVDLPLENLVERENIGFQISVLIDRQKIK